MLTQAVPEPSAFENGKAAGRSAKRKGANGVQHGKGAVKKQALAEEAKQRDDEQERAGRQENGREGKGTYIDIAMEAECSD